MQGQLRTEQGIFKGSTVALTGSVRNYALLGTLCITGTSMWSELCIPVPRMNNDVNLELRRLLPSQRSLKRQHYFVTPRNSDIAGVRVSLVYELKTLRIST